MAPMVAIHESKKKDMRNLLPIVKFLDRFIPAYPIISNKKIFKKDAITYNRPWIMDEIFNNNNWTLQNTKMRSVMNLMKMEETVSEI